ncbi:MULTISPECIES: Ig-like domain repeat protein [unclassified Paenibacillus]|uniref:Ig-like domain repeat protein n=1 Tax=unclassified Paenibacillus TaxID=185978 RepID=UPI0036285BF0
MSLITLNATRDSWGSINLHTVNSETAVQYGQWGYYEEEYNAIACIDFDFNSIPAGATINKATLRVYGSKGQVDVGVSTYVDRITSNWGSNSGLPSSTDANRVNAPSFTTATSAWYEFEVTGIVRDTRQYGGYGFKFWRPFIYYFSYSQQYILGVASGVSTSPKLIVDYTPSNVAPNAPAITAPTWGQNLATRTPTITWLFTDPDAGNYQSAYYVELINSVYSAVLWNSGWISSSGTSFTLPAGVITADGAYYLRIQVKDQSGAINAANGNGPDPAFGNTYFISDTTPPTIGAPSTQQYIAGTTATVYVDGVTDAIGINRVQVYQMRPDGSYYDIGNATHVGNGRYSINATGINVDGNWQFHFRAYDNAGNPAINGNYVAAYVMRDTVAPTISSVQGYSYTNVTSGTRRVWAYGVTDNLSGIGTIYCNYKLPNGTQVNSVVCTKSGSDAYVDIPLSQQGEYRMDFYCIDNAGNWMVGSKTAYFFVDSVISNDPNAAAIYGTTTATIFWQQFYDPTPSSGFSNTKMYLGEWSGSDWVGGTPNLFNGNIVATDSSVLEKNITGLKAGGRYRYTVIHFDNAGNASSYTYREFATKKKIGEKRIKAGGTTISLPIYDPQSGVVGSTARRITLSGGVVGCYELVATTDVNASPMRLTTTQGIKAISK